VSNSAQNFHTARRAFIIMPTYGLVVAPVGFDQGHTELLVHLHYPNIKYAMENFPRGYFMNGELCLYQGFYITPGATWEIRDENIDTIRHHIPNFRQIFSVDDYTPVYLGVRIGDIGTVWEKIRKTNIKMLEKGNIVM